MLIDTIKLKNAIEKYFNFMGEKIDTIKDDSRAIRILARLETQQIKEEEIVKAVEEIAGNYLSVDGVSLRDRTRYE